MPRLACQRINGRILCWKQLRSRILRHLLARQKITSVCLTIPNGTGKTGSCSAATRDAGEKWCSVRPWP